MSWQPQPAIEKMLEAGLVGSTDDWQRVKEYLAQSFAVYLGQEVEPVWEPIYEDISPTSGFAFGIRSRAALAGPLALEWYGVISHEPGDGHTDALVLLFAHDQRVIQFDGKEFLCFMFVPTDDGLRKWKSCGWSSSEMGEWEDYQRLSEVCQEMRKMREAQESPGSEG